MKRSKFILNTSLGIGGLLPVVQTLQALDTTQGPFLATGIKVGEVNQSAAIVWARLTSHSQRVGKPALEPSALYLDESTGEWHPDNYFLDKYTEDRPNRKTKMIYPEGYTVSNIEGAVPGMDGLVRVLYRSQSSAAWKQSDWITVDKGTDFSATIKLENLLPSTEYEIKVEAKSSSSKNITAAMEGRFATAHPANESKAVQFMVTTCHEYSDQDDPSGGGFKIYKHMQAMKPDFMVHTGDVVYYDRKAKNLSLAHWHWQRMFGLANSVDFYKQVPTYFMKDDHDTWMNDCYPGSATQFMGEFTFEQGVEVFKQQVPMSKKPYRTFRWGKDVQIWLMEGREYRSSNEMKDGPDKTIWGKEQMEWFTSTFDASDATYKILISATPIVGPDRPTKKDNHANSGFAFEGAAIRKFLATHKNVFLICGDRHWQYVSQDSTTGLMEFSCGPSSNEHAGGWPKNKILPEHHYLNIVGGFLGVSIQPSSNHSEIIFTHYSVDGAALFTKKFSPQA